MSRVDMRCGYVDTALGQLHYREAGAGAPLVLLHPPPRSALLYRRLTAALQSLGGLRVIAFDLPGFGNSCNLPAGSSMARIADVVAEAIRALGVAPASVFGLHTGNKVAAAMAAQHPEVVRRLVLAGMTHSIILDAERRNAAMREYVRNKPPTDPVADPPAWHDEQVDRLNARGHDALYEANYAFDLAAVLSRIPCRTLVLELAVPDEERLGRQADSLCRLLPHGQPRRLDCNDRELLQARPGELAAVLRDFVATEEPS